MEIEKPFKCTVCGAVSLLHNIYQVLYKKSIFDISCDELIMYVEFHKRRSFASSQEEA